MIMMIMLHRAVVLLYFFGGAKKWRSSRGRSVRLRRRKGKTRERFPIFGRAEYSFNNAGLMNNPRPSVILIYQG